MRMSIDYPMSNLPLGAPQRVHRLTRIVKRLTVAAVYDRRRSRIFDILGGHRPPLQFKAIVWILLLGSGCLDVRGLGHYFFSPAFQFTTAVKGGAAAGS